MGKIDAYSVMNGEQFFDWNLFLAVNPEEYDDEALEIAEGKANDWVTCACGNLCKAIPRDHLGGPVDPLLNELGLEFAENLISMRTYHKHGDEVGLDMMQREARNTLLAIENRSAELLKAIRNGHNH